MASLFEDGGISDRMMRIVEAEIFRHYGQEELAQMSESKAVNEHTHYYTCLEAPEELKAFGLTTVVCREDDRAIVAAFSSGAAASMQCNSLNKFAEQDRPSLLGDEGDEAGREIAEANRLASERERAAEVAAKLESEKARAAAVRDPKDPKLALAQKLAAVQAAK